MRRSAILVGLALVLLGCAADDPYFDVRLSSLNGGAPLLADLQRYDKQLQVFFIPEDVAIAAFTSKVRGDFVVTEPRTFLDDFQLQRYTVRWRFAGGTPNPIFSGFDYSSFNFEAATAAIVPVNTTTEVGVLVAPAAMKTEEPFATALVTGAEILLIADIDFYGVRALVPEGEIHLQASLSVNFADFADEN